MWLSIYKLQLATGPWPFTHLAFEGARRRANGEGETQDSDGRAGANAGLSLQMHRQRQPNHENADDNTVNDDDA
jgi:hypothetical protein